MPLNSSVMFLVIFILLVHFGLVQSKCDCTSASASTDGCLDRCINAARDCMADCNIQALSKNSEIGNDCYSDCMHQYWPQPYVAPGPHQETEIEEQQQPDDLDSKVPLSAPEQPSSDYGTAISHFAVVPDRVSDQEVTQEDQPATDDSAAENLILAAAVKDTPQSSSVGDANRHDDGDGDHSQRTSYESSKENSGQVATVTAYTTSHITVMPDGQPLPTPGSSAKPPRSTSDASYRTPYSLLSLPMIALMFASCV